MLTAAPAPCPGPSDRIDDPPVTAPARTESCYTVLASAGGGGPWETVARLDGREDACDLAEAKAEALGASPDTADGPAVRVMREVGFPDLGFVDRVEIARFPRPRGAYWEKDTPEPPPVACRTAESLRSEPALAVITRLLDAYLQRAELTAIELTHHSPHATVALDTGTFVQDAVKKAALPLPMPDLEVPARVKHLYALVQALLDRLAAEAKGDDPPALAEGRFRRAMARIDERHPDAPAERTRLALASISRYLATAPSARDKLLLVDGLLRGSLKPADRSLLDRVAAGLFTLMPVVQAFAPGPSEDVPASRYVQALALINLHEGRMPDRPADAPPGPPLPEIPSLLTAIEDGHLPRARAALRAGLIRLLDRRGPLMSATDPRVELGAVNDLLTIAMGARGLLSVDRPLLDRLRERSTRQLGPEQVRELIKGERPGIDRARVLLDLIPKMPGTANRGKLADYLVETLTPDALARGMPRGSSRLSWIGPIAALLADLKEAGVDPFTLRQIEQRVDGLLYEIVAEDLIRGMPEPGRRITQVLKLVAGKPLPAGRARDALAEQLAATVRSRAVLDRMVNRFPEAMRARIRTRITDLLGERAPA